MAEIEPSSVVSDAGPLIHLDEMGCLDLLGDFGTVLIPRVVWAEVSGHRRYLRPEDVPRASIIDYVFPATPQFQVLAVSLGLDTGERVAIALAQAKSARLFLCDDAAARLAAESLGLAVRGTIGILIRSIRQGSRSRDQVIGLLRDLPNKSSLYISRRLLDAVTTRVMHE